MKILFNLISLLLISAQIANSQSVTNFRSPVDFDIVMAGNFGEIRENHFHSGIDIKALRGVGSPILAVADGYVSRIGVAPSGYGNFMMINHPDGKQSLYAHLDDFAKPYRDYIREAQTAAKSYAIDKYLGPEKFPVKAGERIATLGNSGSSGGPHLHFEIRDARTGTALNPLTVAGYRVGDNIPPVVHKVYVYELDTMLFGVRHFNLVQTIEYKPNKQGIRVPSDSIIRVCKPFYLAYELIDYKNGRSNTMGITSLTQRVDSLVNFSFEIDKISFSTTRYINTLVQYDKNGASKFHVLRAYQSPNNLLDIYSNVVKQGIIAPPLSLGQHRKLSTILTDEKGNDSQVDLSIRFDERRASLVSKFTPSASDKPVFCNMPFVYEDSMMRVEIPAHSLYDSEFVKIYNQGDRYVVGNRNIPLQKGVKVAIKTDKLKVQPEWNKALLVSVSDNGKYSSIGGSWSNGILTATTRSLGTFSIAFDTIAPTIRPLQKQGALMASQLKYKISDDLSGIKSYSVYIDGQWALAAHDPKNSLLTVDIKRSQIAKNHVVTVEVRDSKNNISTLKEKYSW